MGGGGVVNEVHSSCPLLSEDKILWASSQILEAKISVQVDVKMNSGRCKLLQHIFAKE